jgi:chromosome segregation ATPase
VSAAEDPAEGATIGLDELEKRVHAAARRLRSLSEENERLAARVAELEAAAEKAPPAAAAKDRSAADWRRQRDDVRRRVDRLARRLAALLGDVPS